MMLPGPNSSTTGYVSGFHVLAILGYSMSLAVAGYMDDGESRLTRIRRYIEGLHCHTGGNPRVCQALALAVGQEKRTGELKLAPKACIDKVKEVLERTNDPSWCEAC